jgi:hypothetical protein
VAAHKLLSRIFIRFLAERPFLFINTLPDFRHVQPEHSHYSWKRFNDLFIRQINSLLKVVIASPIDCIVSYQQQGKQTHKQVGSSIYLQEGREKAVDD